MRLDLRLPPGEVRRVVDMGGRVLESNAEEFVRAFVQKGGQ